MGALEVSCQSYNATGSVTHFYHFYFACLIPIIHLRLLYPLPTSISFVTPVGSSFQSILEELSLNLSYSPLPPSLTASTAIEYQKIRLQSYDIYDNRYYHIAPSVPPATRDMVLHYLDELLAKQSLIHINPSTDIILIERDKKGSDYSSGYSRRHIRNHEQLTAAMTLKFGSRFKNIDLERMSFLEQFAIFRFSSIIIAQHGAALSNIFAMKSLSLISCDTLSHVIEISPPYSRRAQYFYNLATSVSVSYSSLYQHRNRGNVSIPEVISHVECILFSWRLYHQCKPEYLGTKCGNIVGELGIIPPH